MNSVIVIPAYKPESTLLSLIENLKNNQQPVIVVNDGSGADYLSLFNILEQYPFVTVLHHAVNLGKGQALKTAFNYFLTHFSLNYQGVVTADADGQHLPEDISRIAQKLQEFPDFLWLGSRTFSQNIPWRSRIGNNMTKYIFKILVGQSLQDTQTGLRGIPREFLKSLLNTVSNGYDFELDMLILASQYPLTIAEIPIQTIYTNNNSGSHFNPVIDSFKIYFVFLRFLVFSIVTGLFDFFAFSVSFLLSGQVFFSEAFARILSGTCNFLFNKEWVFKSEQKWWPEALKYIALCGANLAFSYGLISTLRFLGANTYVSKILALLGLFFANFAIQKLFIFKPLQRSLLAKKSTLKI